MLSYNEIVVNLKLLRRVEKHQKINTRGAFLNVEARSIIPEFVRRWRRGDDRNHTVHQIQQTVLTAIEQTPKYPALKTYLAEAKKGVDNLKETYADCTQTVARLEAITDSIDAALNEGDEPPVEEIPDIDVD